ncbi:MAG: pyruvate ferredoxin oxidoreductase [Candidatus Bathyarchaeota archaeon]|nr:pyruvate ferredoxin oxidoreductase [Candidatus Bathyarchaeota archaeon]
MTRRVGIEVSAAVAEAVRLVDVDVISAYPITPQTHIVEKLAELIANGELDAEYMNVESEHSALSACVGASAAGARTFTASNSQGLALMHEILYVASGCRLPIVLAIVNRALSAPINIWCDHQDSLGERDTGCIQVYVEDGQEAFDSTLQAFRVAEDQRVLVPFMVCLDGFILSHVIESVNLLDEKEIKGFIKSKRESKYRLDPDEPISMGVLGGPDVYSEFRRQQEETMRNAKKVILEVDEEFGKLYGRRYGLFDSYRVEDADVILLTMGSMTGTARVAVDKLREKGKKVGILKVRVFRPFPYKEICDAVRGAKVLATVDRNVEPGAFGGILFTEVRSALYRYEEEPHVVGFITGLGGRDVTLINFMTMAEKALRVAETGKVERAYEFIGLRE